MTKRDWIGFALCAALMGIGCGDDDDTTTAPTTPSTGGDDGMVTDGPMELDIVDTALAAGNFETLAGALTDAGLVETLKGEGPFTVFAPTDAAFAALPAGTLDNISVEQLTDILTYHVVGAEVPSDALDGSPISTVNGASAFIDLSDGVKINGATVTTANIQASNGIIHVIDAVITPPTVVEAAVLAGSFTTLAGALTQADLIETLSGEGPFTVFAPTDDAFAALPEGTLENMDDDTLTAVLTYHVVDGNVLSTDLSEGAVATIQGAEVTVGLGDSVTINDANVVIADVVATNGVIHVIDQVLIPGS